MTYPNAKSLVRSFALTRNVIKLQTDGLTHEDSLRQLPFRGNCLNWVVGHILVGRLNVLKLLGTSPSWGDGYRARYEQGSEPIADSQRALPLDQLLADLDQSQEQIKALLDNIEPEELGKMLRSDDKEEPLASAIAFLHWHETYHTGQLEILRQLAGTDDAII